MGPPMPPVPMNPSLSISNTPPDSNLSVADVLHEPFGRQHVTQTLRLDQFVDFGTRCRELQSLRADIAEEGDLLIACAPGLPGCNDVGKCAGLGIRELRRGRIRQALLLFWSA